MDTDQRFEQLEKQTKRLRIAVVVLATALCSAMVMGATYAKTGDIGDLKALYCDSIYSHTIEVERIRLMDGDGNMHMSISTNPADGFIQGRTKPMPQISMYMPNNFKKAVHIGIDESGGRIAVGNKTGETIVTLSADDYGNGEVGAWNRKGKGRVWDSQ